MAKSQKIDPPRIFISHTWEAKDKALTHRLEKTLREAGAEVWVDHAGIRGGDNLPKQINDALAWCNTLVLVWSKAAIASHWVELEWTNAISLRKRIIPCPLDGALIPPILAHKAYIDFSNEAQGLRKLLAALQLAPPSREAQEPAASPASLPHSPFVASTPPLGSKPPQDKPLRRPRKSQPAPSQPVQAPRSAIIQLRHTPINPLSEASVKEMLKEKNFYDRDWNSSGKGIQHEYKSVEKNGVALVIDHATGLTWQQGGSDWMTFKNAEAYIRQLNGEKFGGYNDWHLPTLEEAMSLMEREKKNGDLYIDSVFDRTQRYIWTADKESAGRAWRVSFYGGGCDRYDFDFDDYVRAVRS